ncbi:YopX family protein [Brevibacillus formosus]|uniref:YopX family protein n=1 Tax=Brevibacillus formosus TaxID=54913 RepID=UPI003F194CBF
MQSRRVVKFRAWDPDREKMMYPMVLNWWEDDGALAFRSEFVDREEPHECTSKYPDEVELLQYTGLRDKNGKEIYEGDIWQNDGSVYVIFWSKEFAGFRTKVVQSDYALIKGLVFTLRQYTEAVNVIEVIGNIYENPELLEAI